MITDERERMNVAVYTDGGLAGKNPGPAAASCVVVSEDGVILLERVAMIREATSNQVEYKALIMGIAMASFCGVETAHFLSDSQLMVNQIQGSFAICDPELGKLHSEAAARLMSLPYWSITHIPREQNRYADYLCNLALRPDDRRAKKNGVTVAFQYAVPVPGWRSISRSR